MKKTLGGVRLGSGNKLQFETQNYQRSTHNLSEILRTTMTCGTLVPFYVNVGLNGDTFDIDLKALARTLPTNGALFGSFKLQMDLFQVPIRLYISELHNNKLGIGMEMDKVYMPKIELFSGTTRRDNIDPAWRQINPSSLMAYLGIKGLGTPATSGMALRRKFNALPVLAYYDIYKNFYANVMENDAYVVGAEVLETQPINFTYLMNYGESQINLNQPNDWEEGNTITFLKDSMQDPEGASSYNVLIQEEDGDVVLGNLAQLIENGTFKVINVEDTTGTITKDYKKPWNKITFLINRPLKQVTIEIIEGQQESGEIQLNAFPLANIDKMREDLLHKDWGEEFVIEDEESYMPYAQLVQHTNMGESFNIFPMNGLAVKTYQSDVFNNWVKTDYVSGTNGVAELTSIQVDANGRFTIDALNLAQKVYNMFNMIAASGGTWEDWQEVVYDEEAIRKAETPIYEGGASAEIVFEEVVSTSDVTQDNNASQALGTLAGKGTLTDFEGGNVIINVKEPCIIMGIASITPRIDYSQGNKWFNTELNSVNDLHKPALDGIGFQDLITEQMAWFDTNADYVQQKITYHRHSAGKQPAWINYMTSYNQALGNFATELNFMVLNRDYDYAEGGGIGDLTTYIDPTKYNYAFADTTLSAQNFLMQFAAHVTARRKISAKVIPNI